MSSNSRLHFKDVFALVKKTKSLTAKKIKSVLSEALSWSKFDFGHKPTKGLYILSQNAKMKKSLKYGVLNYGLELSPVKVSGYNTCPFSTWKGLQCTSICIFMCGNGRFSTVQECRKRRTRMLFTNPLFFFSLLHYDLTILQREAEKKGKELAVRLNTFSDLPWVNVANWLFDEFPSIRFYDYTKDLKQAKRKDLPVNYHLTISMNETISENQAIELLQQGYNIAVVFKGKIPDYLFGAMVFSGENSDLRYMDQPGTVIALEKKQSTAKNQPKNLENKGFVFQIEA